MSEDMLLTTDPDVVTNRPGDDRMAHGEARNENNVNPVMTTSTGLSTFVNSEELRTTIEVVVAENRQLREQLMTCLQHINAYRPRMAELESMKKINTKLKDEIFKCHEKSKTKVLSQKQQIVELQQQNERLVEEVAALRRSSPDGEERDGGGVSHQVGPVLEALKSHVQELDRLLQQELSKETPSLRKGEQEGGETALLDQLMGHIKKAEEILATPIEMYQGTQQAEGGSPGKRRATPPSPEQKPANASDVTSPLSPAGQKAYNHSMENVLEQLQALQQQEIQAKSALAKERERAETLEARLRVTLAELNSFQGTQESHVAAAVERQRREDDAKHQHEMGDMMARLEELTLLAADKHKKGAFDEEPRYHSASNELRQQVMSLVNELKHKEKCLEEEKLHHQQMIQANDDLQKKVKMYHSELSKAREEAQRYIDTIHGELKRKETLCQTERQKAMHERLEHDKCKEDLMAMQAKYNQMEAEWKKFQGHKRNFQETEDRYVAEILSAEEAIEAKDLEKKKFEGEVTKLKNELQLWKEQTSLCKRDFRDERKARELMHTEKMNLQAKVEDLMRENKKIEEELQNFHRLQLNQSHRYHPAPTNFGGDGGYQRGGRYQRGGAELYAPRRQMYDVQPEDEAGTMEPLQPLHTGPSYMRDDQYYQEPRRPTQVTEETPAVPAWCPKCDQTFPDFDTLNIHIAECIE